MAQPYFVRSAFADGAPGGLTNPEAQEHFKKGNALYKAGEFAKAIDEYKAGMLAEPSAVFNFNLGQSYRLLGDYKQAMFHYRRYLNSGLASAPERDTITALIDKMNAELEQQARTAPPTEPATATSLPPSPTPQNPAQPVDRPESDRWYQDPVGWGLSGTGLVAGVVAGVLFIQAADLRNDADAALSATEANALNDKADTRALAGTITGIAAGALVVTGIVKLAIHSTPSAPSSTGLSLGVSSNGLSISGRF